MRNRLLPLVVLGCLLGARGEQPASARFTSVFENAQAAVYTIELPPRGRAAVYQGTRDVIWLALNDAAVNFAGRERSLPAALNTGDVRFFPAFQLAAVSNDQADAARGVLIQLKPRGLATAGCGCGTSTERAICGCPGGAHLPELWALSLGQVTLGGTTLKAGEGFHGSSFRDAMLLVAITDLELRDSAAADAALKLAAGQAQWVAAGPHQFRNVGAGTARFLTVEF